jgi:hypothetical protein
MKMKKTQTLDQGAKGGVMGLFVYFAAKYDMDPELIALLLPLVGAVLAVASQKIGDPDVASFFDGKKADEG